MKANIKIERIGGDNYGLDAKSASICFALKSLYGVNLLEGMKKHRDWVAKITGASEKYGFEREFLAPIKDYANSSSTMRRGVYVNYVIEDGYYYEVSAPVSWKRNDRYFCKSVNGEVIRVEREEIEEWLKAR